MQIKELVLPPNQKKVRYQINKQGETVSLTTTYKIQQIPSLVDKYDASKIQLGQLNSIKLTKQNQFQNMLKENPYSSATKFIKSTLGQKKTFCNCKRSKCLKLYCQCFSNQLFCNPQCSCKCCSNTQANSKRLLLLRQQVGLKKTTQQKGCKCQKSNCRKKYCQCFSRNQQCGKYCSCSNCCNKSAQITKKQEQFHYEEQFQSDE